MGGKCESCVYYSYDEEYDDYIITAKSPLEVARLAEELEKLTKAKFKRGYDSIDGSYPEPKSKEDMEYSWEYLEDAVPFFRHAAGQGLWVLFTADQ